MTTANHCGHCCLLFWAALCNDISLLCEAKWTQRCFTKDRIARRHCLMSGKGREKKGKRKHTCRRLSKRLTVLLHCLRHSNCKIHISSSPQPQLHTDKQTHHCTRLSFFMRTGGLLWGTVCCWNSVVCFSRFSFASSLAAAAWPYWKHPVEFPDVTMA